MLGELDDLYHLTQSERNAINFHRQTDPLTIYSTLNALKTHLEIGKLYYTSKHYSLTSILDIDIKSKIMVLDNTQAFLLNKPVHHEPYLVYKTRHDNLNIQFVAKVLGQRRHADGPGLLVTIPEEILRIQRREYPRFSTIGQGIHCQIISKQNELKRAVVSDLSTQGIALVIPKHTETEAEDDEKNMQACYITLPGIGKLEVSLSIKNSSPLQLKDGKNVTRYGCQFHNLATDQHPMIHQYLQHNKLSYPIH